MKTIEREYIDTTTDGLLVVRDDAPHPARGRVLGDLWYAEGHGAYDPEWGRVPVERDEVARHNEMFATLKQTGMEQSGRATLYLTRRAGEWRVTDWAGTVSVVPTRVSKSTTNWGHARRAAWFFFGGEQWHGVSVGDSELLRCQRLKCRP